MCQKDIKNQWHEKGYFVLPRLFDLAHVTQLRSICDDILEQWRTSNRLAASSTVNIMHHLTRIEYFKHAPTRLLALLEVISDERIISLLEQLTNRPLLFNNTQYLFNPMLGGRRLGEWHRDVQFGVLDEENEQVRMAKIIAIHLHLALLPDDSLEYVPGSQNRSDTLEEQQIRRGLHGKENTSPEMAGAVRISLNHGDVLVFNSWGLHRGRLYDPEKRRSVLDITYGSDQADWYTPPPTCFSSPAWVSGLKPQALLFFERFINVYGQRWEKGEYNY